MSRPVSLVGDWSQQDFNRLKVPPTRERYGEWDPDRGVRAAILGPRWRPSRPSSAGLSGYHRPLTPLFRQVRLSQNPIAIFSISIFQINFCRDGWPSFGSVPGPLLWNIKKEYQRGETQKMIWIFWRRKEGGKRSLELFLVGVKCVPSVSQRPSNATTTRCRLLVLNFLSCLCCCLFSRKSLSLLVILAPVLDVSWTPK